KFVVRTFTLNRATPHWHTGYTCQHAIVVYLRHRVYESRVERLSKIRPAKVRAIICAQWNSGSARIQDRKQRVMTLRHSFCLYSETLTHAGRTSVRSMRHIDRGSAQGYSLKVCKGRVPSNFIFLSALRPSSVGNRQPRTELLRDPAGMASCAYLQLE